MWKQGGSWITMIVLLVGSSFPYVGYSAGGSCATCNRAPSELQNYFRVMDQLLAQIPITPTDEQEEKQETGGIGQDVSQAAVSSIELAGTTMALSVVVSAQTFGDVFGDLKTFYRSESLRRDWQKITDYDIKIARRVLDMTAAQRHRERVPVENLERFDNILQQLGYVQLAKDTQGNYELYKREATYTELVDILWKLNHFYKTLHKKNRYRNLLKEVGTNYRKTDDLDNEEAVKKPENEQIERFMHKVIDLEKRIFTFCQYQTAEPEREVCTPVETLDFAPSGNEQKMKELFTHIRKIQDGYECSTGLRTNECHVWAEIQEDAKELFQERATNDVKRSVNTFLDAWSRLGAALFGPSQENEAAFNQRKEQLVNSYRGTDNIKEEDEGVVEVRSTVDGSPMTIKSLRKGITNIWKRKETDIATDKGKELTTSTEPNKEQQPESHPNPQKYETDQAKQSRLEEVISGARAREQYKWDDVPIDQRSFRINKVLERKISAMQNRFTDNLHMQDELQVESIFTDTNRVTHQFPALSAAIYKNMEIIGKRDTDGQLYHAIGNVCELQCTNLGGTCRYPVN